MGKKMKKKAVPHRAQFDPAALPLHVLFLAIFPVMFLYTVNAKEMNFSAVLPAAAADILLAALIFTASLLIIRNVIKAGFTSSIILLWFFSYGRIYGIIGKNPGVNLHYFMLPVTLLFVAAAVFVVLKTGKKEAGQMKELNMWVNYVTLSLVFLLGVQSAMSIISHERVHILPAGFAQDTAPAPGAEAKYPDIYYIVVDAHSRSDYMKRVFDYDDTDFKAQMKEMGFYIPEKAHSNYPATLLSFASFLNYDYLDSINRLDRNSSDLVVLKDDIKAKRGIQYLKDKGYTFIIFPSAFTTNAMKDGADYVMTPRGINPTEFEQILSKTSALSGILTVLGNGEPPEYGAERKTIRYDFEELPKVAKMPSPKIVLDYIVCPHPPFLFDRDGRDVKNSGPIDLSDGNHCGVPHDKYIAEYGEQAMFVDKMILETVKKLKQNMSSNSIIIIHGDHGDGANLDWENLADTNFGERLSIFLAYYLPGDGAKLLYPSISPVNNFRLILKYYFNEKINLLQDRSYFCKWSKPFDFIDKTKDTQ
jgi:glucan phosphoethanolaminetransferase (alkaline phosphatase superfamily)